MHLSDFDYHLPPELIARFPLEKRNASRLLCLDSKGNITHRKFIDLVDLVQPNDLLVFNNTKVIPARLFAQKESGGKVEMLVERILDEHRILAHLRASKSPRIDSIIISRSVHIHDGSADRIIRFQVIGRHENLFELRCLESPPVLEVIEKLGEIPLPPYLERRPQESDKDRYQTVFAEHKGSVAAPTAGLHFDEDTLNQLKNKNVSIGFVTLHVGAGTFAPVKVEDIKNHHMHAEYLTVSKELCEQVETTRSKGGRIIAIGTTSARSLETASRTGTIEPFTGDTSLFIYPGYEFKCVDVLFTNFHLPKSTLLMLVSTLGGYENTKKAYLEAVAHQYRFFSYGDAMWVESRKNSSL